MSKADTFNWAVLDRDLIAGIVKVAGPEIINQALYPSEITKKIREVIRLFELPINVRVCYNKKTEKDWVWVGGLYDSVSDKAGKKSISIILQFHEKDRLFKMKEKVFRRMIWTFADTVLHEIIHMRQYRRRNYKDIPGYESMAASGKQRLEQVYLGHNDEIDAYSFNIACWLNDKFDGNQNKISNYLNSNLKDKRIKDNCYKMYLNAFDHNHRHPVIKTLKKKVMYYLPNAQDFGKPYRTTDWLKK